jgi:hypothetical protein
VKIVLDTQLLVLLVVGIVSPGYIGKHKRLRAYDIANYSLLAARLAPPVEIIVTPNVLTEASNIASQIADPARQLIRSALTRLFGVVTERYVQSEVAARRPEFLRLGLTDAALLTTTGDDEVLLTGDIDLYLAASYRGIKVENFNHSRES